MRVFKCICACVFLSVCARLCWCVCVCMWACSDSSSPRLWRFLSAATQQLHSSTGSSDCLQTSSKQTSASCRWDLRSFNRLHDPCRRQQLCVPMQTCAADEYEWAAHKLPALKCVRRCMFTQLTEHIHTHLAHTGPQRQLCTHNMGTLWPAVGGPGQRSNEKFVKKKRNTQLRVVMKVSAFILKEETSGGNNRCVSANTSVHDWTGFFGSSAVTLSLSFRAKEIACSSSVYVFLHVCICVSVCARFCVCASLCVCLIAAPTVCKVSLLRPVAVDDEFVHRSSSLFYQLSLSERSRRSQRSIVKHIHLTTQTGSRPS